MANLYEAKVSLLWDYLKREDLLFWLINLYLFFEYVRPQTLYPTIDVLPYPKIILVFALILLMINSNYRFVINPVNKLLLMFFCVILLSSYNALSTRSAFDMVPEFMAWMVIYFLIINIVNSEARFFVFVLAFLIYSFKMSQFSFLNWLSHGLAFRKDGSGGGPGWFKNSGEFGIQMCIFLPLASCFYYSLRSYWPKWKKFIFLLFPITALTGTISCSSRGALLGASGVALFWLLRSKHRMKSLLGLAILASLLFALIPEKQLERLNAAGEDNTSVSRLVLWGRGVELVEKYPYLGVGYKNWPIAQQEIFGLENQLLPHNIFIECASELGLVGLSVFLLLIIFTFVNNYDTRKSLRKLGLSNGFLYFMSHGLDGALIGFIVSGFFVTVMYYPYFWINLSMTVALNTVVKRKPLVLATPDTTVI